MSSHTDRMLGRKTTAKQGRPAMNEARARIIAKVDPDLVAWAKRELLERQLAGERIEVRPGKTRDVDMGDLIGEALAMLKRQRKR